VGRGPEETPNGVAGRTETLQPSAAAWALALAAEKVLLGFKVPRRIRLRNEQALALTTRVRMVTVVRRGRKAGRDVG